MMMTLTSDNLHTISGFELEVFGLELKLEPRFSLFYFSASVPPVLKIPTGKKKTLKIKTNF